MLKNKSTHMFLIYQVCFCGIYSDKKAIDNIIHLHGAVLTLQSMTETIKELYSGHQNRVKQQHRHRYRNAAKQPRQLD
jgi:hypothetical protein